jgi:hypothetical protein
MSAYRDPVEALAARQVALASEVADKTRELAAATNLLEEARAKARLPVLDNLRVASPCTADWAQMTGDDRVRACASCQKNVYNLSELTRDEAEALILEKHGDLCGRYFQRKDGTILLKDCEVGVSRHRKRRLIAAGAVALLGGAGALTALWQSDEAPLQMAGGLSFEPPIEPAIAVELEEPKPARAEPAPEPRPEEQFIMGFVMGPSKEELAADLAARQKELREAQRRVAKARAALAGAQVVQPQRAPAKPAEESDQTDPNDELQPEALSPFDVPNP